MKRRSAAVLGVAATVVAVGVAPAASAQPGTYNPVAQYLRTAGNVRCVVTKEAAACERPGGFVGAPAGQPVASVAADGTFSWVEGGIGPTSGEEVTMVNPQPYRYHGWGLLLTIEGTRLTNIKSVHGMNVSIDGTTVTPY
ncbi:hypothetical protein ACIA48_16465 [Mycobacterium sp. NPDC051804]|uniref:hypothetical protein n=1 Tax=Mycobacterium sp. NPDC051804 TaxID=3364295 RepID=UPI003787D713